MSRRPPSVDELRRDAGIDLEETLVTLWDIGIEYVLNPDDRVFGRDARRARKALGVAGSAELRSLQYWMGLLAMSADDVREYLGEYGVVVGPAASKLPPGGISRLKAEARRRGIDPLKGTSQGSIADESEAAVPVEPSLESTQTEEQSFEWQPLGHERDLRWLTTNEVLGIHHALVRDFSSSADPIEPPGVRSEHLLESAVFRPQTSMGNLLKYNTIETSAAALFHALVLDHPFHNGNKRTALVAMLAFLDENGMMATCNQDELFKLVMKVAQHKVAEPARTDMADREVLAITEWLRRNTRLVVKGETPLQWRKLKRILSVYGCDFSHPSHGNRLDIVRAVHPQSRGILRRRRSRVFKTQVAYTDDGREADISTIKKIRRDLQLDDDHGIDSQVFYEGESKMTIDDFIVKYRKTLNRLAKL